MQLRASLCRKARSSCGFQDKTPQLDCNADETVPPQTLMLQHRIGFCSKKGHRLSPNQDDFLCLVLSEPSALKGRDAEVILGVFDGHGANGHIVSNMVQRLLPKVSPKSPAASSCF